jgi:hypothetical protein
MYPPGKCLFRRISRSAALHPLVSSLPLLRRRSFNQILLTYHRSGARFQNKAFRIQRTNSLVADCEG